MSYASLLVLSFMLDIMVMVQGRPNSKLGIHLNSPLLATSAALTLSACFTIIAVLVTVRQLPSKQASLNKVHLIAHSSDGRA